MYESVSYTIDNSIGIIILQNPPVNALNHSVRKGIKKALSEAIKNNSVKAILITGSGNKFSAGADIKEFGNHSESPNLPEICNLIESSFKPVIAFLNGIAFGGGFEIVLAAHFRIAIQSAKISLPEIHLGLLPGSGGTQRMPRITGVEYALDMMLKGHPVPMENAYSVGLIDQIIDDENSLQSSINYVKEVISNKYEIIRTSERSEGLKDENKNRNALEKNFNDLKKNAKGLFAPFKILECIEKSISVPFKDGLEFERETFKSCLNSPQSKGLIHAFFAERNSKKIPEVINTSPRNLEKIAVIGGGTMGSGIAVAALDAGMEVLMIERDHEGLSKGRKNVEDVYNRHIKKGRISLETKDKVLERYFSSVDFNDISSADIVIEAVFEDMEVKKEVFKIIDQEARDGAVLASNTSYLNIDEIASSTSRPNDVLGLHFFSPANIMKLLEIVVPNRVSNDAVATGFALAVKMGKIPVRAGNSEGFIGNRILRTYSNAASYLMEDGASPYEIDTAVREFGYPIGPFQMFDLAGGDIGWANRKRQSKSRDSRERYVHIADRLCERGWFGQKTGRGFYIYKDGSRTGIEDQEVLKIIDEERSKKNIKPRKFNKEEIMRRYISAMVNEGSKVLQDKVALRPSDIDVTKLFGYAFPKYRGGPMKYADMYGINNILRDIQEFAEEDPFFWNPSDLLKDLVKHSKNFDNLNI